MSSPSDLRFEQIHIDAARNATDDFNPFHDPRKCGAIRHNPYSGPIALGFQLEGLIEYLIGQHREANAEAAYIQEHDLRYSNYQLNFVDALLPGQTFSVEIKPSIAKSDPAGLSNRVIIRRQDRSLLLMGYKRESREPLFLPDLDASAFPEVTQAPDREYLPGTDYFLKRKFFTTANAKNLLAGSLADQGHYFDELEDKIRFPEMYPCALISCALLEHAMNEGHDFYTNPMVYTAHNISVDRLLAATMRSNDRLAMLVQGPMTIDAEQQGLGKAEVPLQRYRCLGLVREQQVLYRAEVYLAPLSAIAASQ
ncbi:hypothetical protein [Methylococcus sp. EFPC2]|uniref:hypothetical protein n=1 Tax=Methylococcus sp. EFPC2 TaxID=2812648 RepID=UPI0019677747|nr:hypothetical protein [Methylococcus sp. EFPC2]QSA95527.1 hypothetical protein JWZ97_09685 [Methylococcus sp. EFPC2]